MSKVFEKVISQSPYIILAIIPLIFFPGWGDGWNDPKIFFIGISLLLLIVGKVFFTETQMSDVAQVWGVTQKLGLSLLIFSLWIFVQTKFLIESEGVNLRLVFALIVLGFILLFEDSIVGYSNITFQTDSYSQDDSHSQAHSQIRSTYCFFKMLIVVVVIESLLVLFQFFVFDPIPGSSPGALLKWRSTGTLGNPNRVAGFMGLSIAIFLDNREFVKQAVLDLKIFSNKKLKYILSIMISIVILALAVTFSRSTWLSLFLAFVFQYFYNLKIEKTPLMFNVAWIEKTGLLNWASVEGRWNEALFALQTVWSQNIWYGIGWGNYKKTIGHASEYLPNEFVSALVEGGVIGFVLFILIWTFAIQFLWKRKQRWAPLFLLLLSFFDFPLKDPGILAVIIGYFLSEKSQPAKIL